jgi:DNA-binding MarR family transcriptional regulator
MAKKKAARFRMPASVSRAALLDAGGGSDRGFRQFLYDFSSLGAKLEAARGYLAGRIGLTSPQYNVVMIVAQYPDASVSDVAARLHVTTAAVTGETKRLERMGWVEKRTNPRDGRGVLLRLTPMGEARVREIGPERRAVNDQLFRRMSGREFRQLAESMAGLIEDFSETVAMLRQPKAGRGDRVPD